MLSTVVFTMIPLTSASCHLSHDSNDQRSLSVVVVNSFFPVFFPAGVS